MNKFKLYFAGCFIVAGAILVCGPVQTATAGPASWFSKGSVDQAEKKFRKARSAYGSADYAKVIKIVNEIVKDTPSFAKGYALRGKAYKDMGDVDKAFADLNKAIKLDPTLGEAWFIRGQANEIMGEVGKAKSDYVNACKNGYKTAC